MVEGGRVDHAGHANDAASIVHEQLAFDRALGAVWELTRDRSDTLVIVTSDHGNANPALSKGGSKTWQGIQLLNRAQHSFEWIFKQAMGDVKDDDGVPVVDQASPEATLKRCVRLAEVVKATCTSS